MGSRSSIFTLQSLAMSPSLFRCQSLMHLSNQCSGIKSLTHPCQVRSPRQHMKHNSPWHSLFPSLAAQAPPVLLHGIANTMWTGTPNTSAHWTCVKLGGLARMASATNGNPISGSGNTHASQKPASICSYIWRLRWIAPSRIKGRLGLWVGLETIYAISSAGSPLIGKNSRLVDRMKLAKMLCVAMRTRWASCCKALPRARNSWTSPRLRLQCWGEWEMRCSGVSTAVVLRRRIHLLPRWWRILL